jgi:hypothetical protein
MASSSSANSNKNSKANRNRVAPASQLTLASFFAPSRKRVHHIDLTAETDDPSSPSPSLSPSPKKPKTTTSPPLSVSVSTTVPASVSQPFVLSKARLPASHRHNVSLPPTSNSPSSSHKHSSIPSDSRPSHDPTPSASHTQAHTDARESALSFRQKLQDRHLSHQARWDALDTTSQDQANASSDVTIEVDDDITSPQFTEAGRKKKHNLGPSGLTYTPLEQQVALSISFKRQTYSLLTQVLRLKRDNPGVLLFFEASLFLQTC